MLNTPTFVSPALLSPTLTSLLFVNKDDLKLTDRNVKKFFDPLVLTCPTCKKRYYAKPQDIGESRPVRCSSCESIWVAEATTENEIDVLSLGQELAAPYKAFEAKTSLILPPASSKRPRKALAPSKRTSLLFFVIGGFLLVFAQDISQLVRGQNPSPLAGRIWAHVKKYTSALSTHMPLIQPAIKQETQPAKTPPQKPILALSDLSVTHAQNNGRITLKGRVKNASALSLEKIPLKIEMIRCASPQRSACKAENFETLHHQNMLTKITRRLSVSLNLGPSETKAFTYTLADAPQNLYAVSVTPDP